MHWGYVAAMCPVVRSTEWRLFVPTVYGWVFGLPYQDCSGAILGGPTVLTRCQKQLKNHHFGLHGDMGTGNGTKERLRAVVNTNKDVEA